ncbi:MAG: hypothetical protein C5B50_17465 [Verrucomicrobia bacterium]|nr:MAG: hypothetical protein C5B50_17465 [Verrucomicrobiota bacterium]
MSDRTPHYLLNGLAGWRAAFLDNTVLARSGTCLALLSMPGALRPLTDAAGSFGGLQAAIGVALDRQDRVYILDGKACVIKRFDPCHSQFVTLPCVGGTGSQPRQFSGPRGLAISCSDDIYVADTGNRRIQIFSIRGLALRCIWEPLHVTLGASGVAVRKALPIKQALPSGTDCQATITWPTGTWQPWDVVISRCNRVYISDYANGLIHAFDANGCWQAAFTGVGPALPQLVKPTRLGLDSEGRIYIVQENQSYIVVLDADGNFAGKVDKPDQIAGHFCPTAVAVDVNGDLCLSDCVTRRTYFYQPAGEGRWCPFRCCGSSGIFAAALMFDRSGHPLYADGGQRVCQLVPPAVYQTKGTYYSEALDSKTYRSVWHRVTLAGRVPPGTAVKVDTFTAESLKPIDEIQSLDESRWGTNQIATNMPNGKWDCLVLSTPGRYLWLRLTLSGDGSATPALEQAKVYYPRASTLQYMPAVYRQDPAQGDFLDRFLSLFDTIRNHTSEQITDVAKYFDPKATPATRSHDFLSWLAGWLGLSLRSNWPIARRRELVRQAHRLYALRGTREGMCLHIELYAGLRPRILEQFRLRRWLVVNHSRLGDCTTVFGKSIMNRLQIGLNSRIGSFELLDHGDPNLDFFNAYAYQFLVVLPRWPGATEGDRQALQQIIDLAKPAFTLGRLEFQKPRFRVGIQGFLGVDTVISRYPSGVIEGQGSLGYDTVLGSPGQAPAQKPLRIGRDSRLGQNAILN